MKITAGLTESNTGHRKCKRVAGFQVQSCLMAAHILELNCYLIILCVCEMHSRGAHRCCGEAGSRRKSSTQACFLGGMTRPLLPTVCLQTSNINVTSESVTLNFRPHLCLSGNVNFKKNPVQPQVQEALL